MTRGRGSRFVAGSAPRAALRIALAVVLLLAPLLWLGEAGVPAVEAAPPPASSSFTLDARQEPPGLDTRIDLVAGQAFSVSASGRAGYGYEGAGCVGWPQTDPDGQRYLDGLACGPKNDPNLVLSGRPVGLLIGRVGGGPWFAVGSGYSGRAGAAGRLYLLYNEVYWADNTGSYSVTVTTEPAATVTPAPTVTRQAPIPSPAPTSAPVATLAPSPAAPAPTSVPDATRPPAPAATPAAGGGPLVASGNLLRIPDLAWGTTNGEYGDSGEDAVWRANDGDYGTAWSSRETSNSWWRVDFRRGINPVPVQVAQVAIWGRGGGDWTAWRLEFSDGSAVDFGSLNGDGCRRAIRFSPRSTTFIRVSVSGELGGRSTTGFREIEAYSAPVHPDGDDCGRQLPPPPAQPGPRKGELYGLSKGTQIRTGPGFGYPSTIPSEWGSAVPHDDWMVLVREGPVCLNGWEWWDIDRRAAGDSSGGTGWAAIATCTFVQAPGRPAIHKVRDGERSEMPNLPAFQAAGGQMDGSNVTAAPQDVINSVPTAPSQAEGDSGQFKRTEEAEEAVGIVNEVISSFDTICRILQCTGFPNSVKAKVLQIISRLNIVANLAHAGAMAPIVGKDLENLEQAVATYGSNSPQAREAAHIACLHNREMGRALIDSLPVVGLFIPLPDCT